MTDCWLPNSMKGLACGNVLEYTVENGKVHHVCVVIPGYEEHLDHACACGWKWVQ